MRTNPVSDFLRAEVATIATEWVALACERLPVLQKLERGALIDHLPEFLIGLAAWIDGDEELGRTGFTALVEGHALQRLGHGIPLSTVSSEYQLLRTVIITKLLVIEGSEQNRRLLIRFHEGVDFATAQAIHAFADRRDNLRERFISILGHDLRNPLNAILLGASAINSARCSQPKHETIAATVQRSALRMQRMIGDVMDFAHAHLGDGIPVVPVRCDLGMITREALNELIAGNPDRDLAIETRGDLAGYWDHDRVLQAMSNLIANAIQHGTDPIRIEVLEGADKLAVTTRVTNGGTIPADLVDQLFVPFGPRRAAESRRAGLGLGLFIVQQIALGHGATCAIRSADGQTMFEIVWPRVPVEQMSDRT